LAGTTAFGWSGLDNGFRTENGGESREANQKSEEEKL